MYIIVENEQNEHLGIIKESDFGHWLEQHSMGIVHFLSREDICSATVGKME